MADYSSDRVMDVARRLAERAFFNSTIVRETFGGAEVETLIGRAFVPAAVVKLARRLHRRGHTIDGRSLDSLFAGL